MLKKKLIRLLVSKELELSFLIPDNIPNYIYTDSLRLRQILVNLLSNAVKFTSQGRVEFKVTFTEKDDKFGFLKFSVLDTGIGISLENQKKLFNAFTQADTSTTRKYGGTGLGLSISAKLLKKFGGKINIISELDKGSEFFFTIETEYDNKPQKQIKSSKHIVNFINYDKIKILIAEDVEMNMLLITTLLKKVLPNSEILKATNGNKAVEIAINLHPELIFMDVHMPGLNGLETVKLIRKYEIDNNVCNPSIIIALTASAFNTEKEKCLEVGMNEFLSKPIETKYLYKILNKYFKNEYNFDSNITDNNMTVMPELSGISLNDEIKHFDKEKLLRQFEYNDKIISQMLSTVKNNFYKYIETIDESIIKNDSEKLEYALHKLKGACLTMHFDKLANLTVSMEKLNSQKALDEIKKLFLKLKIEWEYLENQI